jgi:hypothetical protein
LREFTGCPTGQAPSAQALAVAQDVDYWWAYSTTASLAFERAVEAMVVLQGVTLQAKSALEQYDLAGSSPEALPTEGHPKALQHQVKSRSRSPTSHPLTPHLMHPLG